MKKLLFVCGPSGIGKSYFCNKYISEHPQEHVEVFAIDEVKKEILANYDKIAKETTKSYLEICKQAKKRFKENESITIIFDMAMLDDNRRLLFLNHLPKVDKTICYLIKLRDYSKIYQRNKERKEEKEVPDEIIASMITIYKDLGVEASKRFDRIFTVYND